jgi:LmbE family N-acetylglucosaminyl deacetylase
MRTTVVVGFLFAAFLAGASARAAVPEGDLLAGVAPGPDGFIDVVNIMPHQDDESAFAGGTLAKLAKDPGVRVHIVCLTLGDMSDARFFMRVSKEEMGRIRTEELVNAARALGAFEVIQLSYHDQGLKSADRESLIREVAAIVEKTGAELVITLDPAGITRHPDHVTCSKVVTAAMGLGSSARLDYATLPPARHLYAVLTSPFFEPGKPEWPTLRVDITATLPEKRNALNAHVSQMKRSLVGLFVRPYFEDPNEHFAPAKIEGRP